MRGSIGASKEEPVHDSVPQILDRYFELAARSGVRGIVA